MLRESVELLQLKEGDVAVDLTVGAGGHTAALLKAVGPTGRVVGFDQDASALRLASERLKEHLTDQTLTLVNKPFSNVLATLTDLGLKGKASGILADIGVSSMHLDDPERGFSFQMNGPLDMRMDPSSGESAADFVNSRSEQELAKIFFDFGEDPKSKQIARAIVRERETAPFTTTKQLADLVVRAARYPTASKKHPATRVFQALRIAVNDELGQLRSMLEGAFEALAPGGRLAIIAFHSLEDRIVKEFFIGLTGRRERSQIPRDLPMLDREVQNAARPRAEIVKPFPVVPSDDEVHGNARARSAKLRVAIKLESP